MSNKSWDELSPEAKVLGVLLGGPFVLLVTAFLTILDLSVSFWEAWVALQIWGWHVPQELPSWMNWWTLGWANVAVSTMIRHRQPSIQKQYLKNGWGTFSDALLAG